MALRGQIRREPATDPKRRFSSRVDEYKKFRPGYPAAIVGLLQAECHLTQESVVADIGSGTGIMTQVFLPHCSLVYAVEPNNEMRGASEELLGHDAKFISIRGSAESTTLDDHS